MEKNTEIRKEFDTITISSTTTIQTVMFDDNGVEKFKLLNNFNFAQVPALKKYNKFGLSSTIKKWDILQHDPHAAALLTVLCDNAGNHQRIIFSRNNSRHYVYSKHKKDLQALVGVKNRSAFNRAYNILVSAGILKKVDFFGEKFYCVNPLWFVPAAACGWVSMPVIAAFADDMMPYINPRHTDTIQYIEGKKREYEKYYSGRRVVGVKKNTTELVSDNTATAAPVAAYTRDLQDVAAGLTAAYNSIDLSKKNNTSVSFTASNRGFIEFVQTVALGVPMTAAAREFEEKEGYKYRKNLECVSVASVDDNSATTATADPVEVFEGVEVAADEGVAAWLDDVHVATVEENYNKYILPDADPVSLMNQFKEIVLNGCVADTYKLNQFNTMQKFSSPVDVCTSASNMGENVWFLVQQLPKLTIKGMTAIKSWYKADKAGKEALQESILPYLRKKENNNIIYRNIAFDIDLGKGSNGEYLDDSTVKDNKITVKGFVDMLSDMTSTDITVVESRNGFHLYISIVPTNDYNKWLAAANFFTDLLKGVVDPVVTADKCRILRVPNSIHDKHVDGIQPFNVRILHAAKERYNIDDVVARFAALQDDIKECCKMLVDVVPALQNTISSKKEKMTRPAVKKLNTAAPVAAAKSFTDADIVKGLDTLIYKYAAKIATYDPMKSNTFDFLRLEIPLHLAFGVALDEKFNDFTKTHDSEPSCNISYTHEAGYRFYGWSAGSSIEPNNKGWDISDTFAHFHNLTRSQAKFRICILARKYYKMQQQEKAYNNYYYHGNEITLNPAA